LKKGGEGMRMILAVVIIFTYSTLQGSQRVVVAEMFTNVGCPPCGPADDTLDNIAEDFSSGLAVIRYHTWWPDPSDPFYQANPSENSARINYYGTSYTPRLMIDGSIDGQYTPQTWRTLIQQRMSVSSPLEINLVGGFDLNDLKGNIVAEITGTGPVYGSNLKIRYVIIESGIYYPWPYGSPYHNQTMRDFFPTVTGVPISISQGSTVVDTQDFVLSSNWEFSNCEIVVFVQNDITREILQGAKIPLSELYICGDTNGDHIINMSDLSYLANYLLFGGPSPAYPWAADVNGDGGINAADMSYFGSYLFFGGPPPDCP
jgi:hypothetical protein